MAAIKPYEKNGKTFYMFQLYIGIDPLTGKVRKTTRRGFKTKKEASSNSLDCNLKSTKARMYANPLKRIAKCMIYGLCSTRTQ